MGGGEAIEKERKKDEAWAPSINTVIRVLTFANGSSLSCVGSTGETSRQDNERKTCDQQKDTREAGSRNGGSHTETCNVALTLYVRLS